MSREPKRGGHLATRCSSSKSYGTSTANPSGFITLLTDFGVEDAYVGVMKGVIARINPKAIILDLCHQISPQNVREAAFLLATSYSYFPKGTIHVAVVDPTVGSSRRAICVAAGDFFFVGPDNGILAPAVRRAGLQRIHAITNKDFVLKSRSRTFHGRDVFAPAAAHLSSGVPIQQMGERLRTIEQTELPLPRVTQGKRIVGLILYVDRFGNLISNIDEETLGSAFPNAREKELIVHCAGRQIIGLKKTYSAAVPGVALAVIGSYNLLEVAVREGSAAEMLRAGEGIEITVEHSRKAG